MNRREQVECRPISGTPWPNLASSYYFRFPRLLDSAFDFNPSNVAEVDRYPNEYCVSRF